MIKVFEMFAGYGGASFALTKANIDFITVGYSEIDKNAIKCYDMNHLNYNYPIELSDLKRLCSSCHSKHHKRGMFITPLPPVAYGDLK